MTELALGHAPAAHRTGHPDAHGQDAAAALRQI